MKAFWKGFEKAAYIGPAVSVGALGLPEVVGYQLGKTEGLTVPKDKRKDTTSGTIGKAVKWLLIPGATGYYFGKKKGQKIADNDNK